MNHKRVRQWLDARKLTLEEDFPTALRRLARDYKRANGLKTVDGIYLQIGVSKQDISYWASNPGRTQTRKFRSTVIESAAAVFGLSKQESESLANKAGLSLQYTEDFTEYLLEALRHSSLRQREIVETANVSERMFELIKKGEHPSKETLLALSITLGAEIDDINLLLQKAGYILSRSLVSDTVVMWLLEHDERKNKSTPLTAFINGVLAELELPLLMTRQQILSPETKKSKFVSGIG
jgi:transcriptional regulator with XRE-family HTH domain